MSEFSEMLRQQHLHDVTSALVDYVERGGNLQFRSEGDGTPTLVIEFELSDDQLYHGLLNERMTRSMQGLGPNRPPRDIAECP